MPRKNKLQNLFTTMKNSSVNPVASGGGVKNTPTLIVIGLIYCEYFRTVSLSRGGVLKQKMAAKHTSFLCEEVLWT